MLLLLLEYVKSAKINYMAWLFFFVLAVFNCFYDSVLCVYL